MAVTEVEEEPEPVQVPARINMAHVTAAGAVGIIMPDNLASVYHWLLTWPIQHPTPDECKSLAIITLAIAGGGTFAAFQRRVQKLLAGEQSKLSPLAKIKSSIISSKGS